MRKSEAVERGKAGKDMQIYSSTQLSLPLELLRLMEPAHRNQHLCGQIQLGVQANAAPRRAMACRPSHLMVEGGGAIEDEADGHPPRLCVRDQSTARRAARIANPVASRLAAEFPA